jgi:TPP-dependent pyruvate/acetoin dehydrogenase alpha subunit
MPRRPSAAGAATPHPLISNDRLQHLYVTLLRTRLLRQRNRLAGNAALVARESIVTGTVTHLETGDVTMPAAGDRLAALARGHALRRVITAAPLPGILTSPSTVEARFAIATGFAMAHRGTKHIVLAFSGPGVTSLDALGPTLGYAAQHKLGIVFVIETTADAELSSAGHTDPLGLYGIPVDGNDVVAIYRVAQEAMHRARRGAGPTLIDCKPWPLTTKSDGSADAVRRLEQAMERRGLLTGKLKERTLAAFKRELNRTRRKR